MSNKGRRKDLMERELLRGAAELFARKGFSGTTLRDIAESAGVGRTTLYHYFASKDELLAALVEDQTTRSYEELCEIRSRSDLTPRQMLAEAVTALALRVLEQPMRFRVVERDEASLPPEVLEQQKVIKRKALDELTAIIESGIRDGTFRVIDAHLAGLSIFGMCNWPAWWFNPKGPKSPGEVAGEISNFALMGLVRERPQSSGSPQSIIDDVRLELDRLSQMITDQT